MQVGFSRVSRVSRASSRRVIRSHIYIIYSPLKAVFTENGEKCNGRKLSFFLSFFLEESQNPGRTEGGLSSGCSAGPSSEILQNPVRLNSDHCMKIKLTERLFVTW